MVSQIRETRLRSRYLDIWAGGCEAKQVVACNDQIQQKADRLVNVRVRECAQEFARVLARGAWELEGNGTEVRNATCEI